MRLKDKELPFLIYMPDDEMLLVINKGKRNFYLVTKEVNLRKKATIKYKTPDKNRRIISANSLQGDGIFPEDLNDNRKYHLVKGLF